ncbi:hypothetical protein Cni_G14755 [Canna indica]|uniref:Protein kinase domain-containing protein n=1 Tax=Canna indica TaxID=4628 RepID=A0AAQ3KFP5_9LILI|nr:hypothetical protein Cni_G14755 [Canna indica]
MREEAGSLVVVTGKGGGVELGQRGNILGATELQGPLNFHYKDLKDATENFSEENKLGEGGFGEVYKGVLKNGKTVAVKRMIVEQTSRAKEDFQSEVRLISNVHHRNLIRLLGCSHKGQDLLLVYEYMANSSLERGYTAPEYALHGQLSEKVDTYSYGIVVLELISGRKCNDVNLQPVTQYLLEWAWKLHESNELIRLVDETLDPSEYTLEEVKRVIEIALLCTQSSAAARPTMTEVVILLLSQGDDGFQLTRPTFIDSMSRVQEDQSSNTRSSAMSRATVSISQYSGR